MNKNAKKSDIMINSVLQLVRSENNIGASKTIKSNLLHTILTILVLCALTKSLFHIGHFVVCLKLDFTQSGGPNALISHIDQLACSPCVQKAALYDFLLFNKVIFQLSKQNKRRRMWEHSIDSLEVYTLKQTYL